MKIKFYTKPFRLTLSIYIACFLLGACSKLGNRYGISATVDNAPSNNIENPDASLSDSTQKLFAAIKDSNLEKVKQLLKNDFNDDAFMHLCQTNAYGNTCLHVAAGAEHVEKPLDAEKIMALLLDRMKPFLLTKEAFEKVVHEIDILDRIYSGSIRDSRQYFEQRSTFFKKDKPCIKRDKGFFIERDNFWSLDRYYNRSEKRDKLLKILKNIQPQRCNTDSELMRKNNKGETPIYAAIHYGSSGVMEELVTYTHKLIGLDLADQTGKSLPIIFQYLMDHNNDNKLENLVNHYCQRPQDRLINGTWDMIHKYDRYFSPDTCNACTRAKKINNKQINKLQSFLKQDQTSNDKDLRIEAVLREVGITDSEISRFFASRIPFSPNALSASLAPSDGHSSSSSRGHIVHPHRYHPYFNKQ